MFVGGGSVVYRQLKSSFPRMRNRAALSAACQSLPSFGSRSVIAEGGNERIKENPAESGGF
jgi:hypothetical protein